MASTMSNPYPKGSMEWCEFEADLTSKASYVGPERSAEPVASGERGIKRRVEPEVTGERESKRIKVQSRAQRRHQAYATQPSRAASVTVPSTSQAAQPISLRRFVERGGVLATGSESKAPELAEMYIDAGECVELDEEEDEEEASVLPESGDIHATDEDEFELKLAEALAEALMESEGELDEDAPLREDEDLFGEDDVVQPSLVCAVSGLLTPPPCTPPSSPQRAQVGLALPTGTLPSASQPQPEQPVVQTTGKKPAATRKGSKARASPEADTPAVAHAVHTAQPARVRDMAARWFATYAAAATAPEARTVAEPLSKPSTPEVVDLTGDDNVPAPVAKTTPLQSAPETKQERRARLKREHEARKAAKDAETLAFMGLSKREQDALIEQQRVAAGEKAVLSREEMEELPSEGRRKRSAASVKAWRAARKRN